MMPRRPETLTMGSLTEDSLAAMRFVGRDAGAASKYNFDLRRCTMPGVPAPPLFAAAFRHNKRHAWAVWRRVLRRSSLQERSCRPPRTQALAPEGPPQPRPRENFGHRRREYSRLADEPRYAEYAPQSPSISRPSIGSSWTMFFGPLFRSAPAAGAAACIRSAATPSTIARWGKAQGLADYVKSSDRPAIGLPARSPTIRGIAPAILPSCAPRSWWRPASRFISSTGFAARPSCRWRCGIFAARAAS